MPALRRRTALVALLVALVSSGIGAAWLLRPLGPGSAGVASGPLGSDLGTASSTGAAVIWFVPSGRVAFGVEVRNTTFVPVTIEGLGSGDGSGFLLDDVRLVLGNGPSFGLEDDQTRAFEPFSLGPGASQLIGIVGRFPDCAHARPNWTTGTGVTTYALRFDVRIAGILLAEADVALLQPVDLRGNDEEACR